LVVVHGVRPARRARSGDWGADDDWRECEIHLTAPLRAH